MTEIETILIPVLVLGGSGLLMALGLGLASKKFAVKVDPRVEAVDRALPQINCGACGYAGCRQYAEAVALKGEAVNKCIPGGEAVAKSVGEIMGVSVEESDRVALKAIVRCQGEKDKAKERYNYNGVESCRAVNLMGGGFKECPTGCLFFGDCAASCPFEAFDHVPGTVPQVIWSKCTGCGTCVSVCPKGLIELIPETSKVTVRCISPDKGAVTRKYCVVGCIACKACERVCPTDPKSIVVENNRAVINTETCINCGKCAAVCPTLCIQDRRLAKTVPEETKGFPAVLSTRWPLPAKREKKPKKAGAPEDGKTVAKEAPKGSESESV